MLTDITLGQYFPGKSFIHRLDPRTKIISTLLFISSIFLAEHYLSYVSLLVFTTLTLAASRLPVMLIFKSIRPLWFIIVLTLLIHMFTAPGTVIFNIGPATITQEGVVLGARMAARLLFLILISSLLTYTTSPIVLTDGIERLLNPFRRFGLPAHELAMMMTIALRFIPTLLEEADRIIKAQMARGADFTSGNILKRAKNLVSLLVPLFISAFRRADELATAMEARCYRGGLNRTRMKVLRMTMEDGVAFVGIILFIGLLVFLRWGYLNG